MVGSIIMEKSDVSDHEMSYEDGNLSSNHARICDCSFIATEVTLRPVNYEHVPIPFFQIGVLHARQPIGEVHVIQIAVCDEDGWIGSVEVGSSYSCHIIK